MEADNAMSAADAWEVLGLGGDEGDEEIRQAYLRGVKQFPPDRAGEQFQRVRDAYELLRDPRRRAAAVLQVDPAAPLVSLLDGEAPRRFVGPGPWLAAMAQELGPAEEGSHA